MNLHIHNGLQKQEITKPIRGSGILLLDPSILLHIVPLALVSGFSYCLDQYTGFWVEKR